MPRKRMINPEIWTDEGFLELPIEGRLLFIGLFSLADDEGKGRGSAKGLKAQIFPCDDISLEQIEELKRSISELMGVYFYSVNGKEYYLLTAWTKHQSINKPSGSSIPDPENEGYGRPTGTLPEDYGRTTLERKEEKERKEGNSESNPADSTPSFRDSSNKKRWKAYHDQIVEVLAHYNQIRKRSLSPDTENYVKLLGILFEANYTVGQCIAVIDSQWAEWGNDEKMRKFHRPETLFAYENFQKYLPDAEELQRAKKAQEERGNRDHLGRRNHRENPEEYVDPEMAQKKLGEIKAQLSDKSATEKEWDLPP